MAATTSSTSSSSVQVGLSDNFKDVVVQHRKNVSKFNPELAETVGLLRVRKELKGTSQSVWQKKADSPQPKPVLKGLRAITFKEMKVDEVYKGRVIHLTIVDNSTYFEFEPANSLLTQHVSVVSLLQDRNGDLQRGFIYNYVLPSLIGEYVDVDEIEKFGDVDAENVQSKLGFGFNISVIEPQLIKGVDGGLALVVTDPNKVLVIKGATSEKICRYCLKSNAESRCVRCHAAHYCSKKCQEDDWMKMGHKLVCISKEKAGKNAAAYHRLVGQFYPHICGRRPKWSVYQLEQICYDDLCPSLEQKVLRNDYGFANCATIKEEGNLIGLYQGMIKFMRVDMVEMHKAMIKNKLDEFIRKNFEDHPEEIRGQYYKMFLQRPDVVKRRDQQ